MTQSALQTILSSIHACMSQSALQRKPSHIFLCVRSIIFTGNLVIHFCVIDSNNLTVNLAQVDQASIQRVSHPRIPCVDPQSFWQGRTPTAPSSVWTASQGQEACVRWLLRLPVSSLSSSFCLSVCLSVTLSVFLSQLMLCVCVCFVLCRVELFHLSFFISDWTCSFASVIFLVLGLYDSLFLSST